MKYIVDITDAALEDMDAIYEYILYRFKTPDTAAALYDRIAYDNTPGRSLRRSAGRMYIMPRSESA